jgi:hypothetical protein
MATRLNPPGLLTDLQEDNLAGWNDTISAYFEKSRCAQQPGWMTCSSGDLDQPATARANSAHTDCADRPCRQLASAGRARARPRSPDGARRSAAADRR